MVVGSAKTTDNNNSGEDMSIHWLSQWSRSVLVVAATLWLANWSALHVEPGHGPVYLMVIGGFLVSTLPRWSRLRD